MVKAPLKVSDRETEGKYIRRVVADVRAELADMLAVVHRLESDARESDYAHKQTKIGELSFMQSMRYLEILDACADEVEGVRK